MFTKNNTAVAVLFSVFFSFSLAGFCAQEKKTMVVSFEEISKLALENNLDIQIAKFDTYIKRNELGTAKSIFDTFFSANISYDKNKEDTASTLLGTKSTAYDYSLEINKKLPSGTDLGITAYNRRSWTNSSFYTINPNTEANVGISLTQPLAKNFFGIADRGKIKITRLDIKNSEWSSLTDIENALFSAQQAYWELVFRYKEMRIREDMLKRAEELFSIYKDKIKKGLAEEPDLFAAHANVLQKKNELSQAKMRIQQAANNLLYLLNIADREIEVVPSEDLDIFVEKFNLYKELAQAVKSRRDYKIIKNRIKAEKINVALKKNSLWPEVDLEASFVRNGISGSPTDAWEKISGENHSHWYAGLKIQFSLEKRREHSEYNQAKLNKARLLILLKKIERLIFKEVNDNITALNTLANEVITNKKIVKLQEAKLNSEEKRLKYGRSSSDIIIRFQNDLLASRLNLAASLFSYRVARLNLKRKENVLLSEYWKGKI